jgi:hypothetical protein
MLGRAGASDSGWSQQQLMDSIACNSAQVLTETNAAALLGRSRSRMARRGTNVRMASV